MGNVRYAKATDLWVTGAAGRGGMERPTHDELLQRMERLLPECEPAVGELLRPVIEAARCRQWERARPCALEFLAKTSQDPLNERMFEYQLQQLVSSDSKGEVAIETYIVTKFRVLVRQLILGARP